MRTLFIAAFLALMAPFSWAASTCASAGAFTNASTPTCCQGLALDGNKRCQYPGCKPVGAAAVVGSNGTSDCCFGLAPVSGTCRAPTLQRICTVQGGIPTTATPCCVGLTKNANGTCQRNSVATCSATQIPSCCNGGPLNTCACYCPSNYYIER